MKKQRLVIRWELRQVMTQRGMYQTSDLVEPLEELGIHLSRQYVHRLVTHAPQRVNVDLLAALCEILDCGPGDLLRARFEVVEPPVAAASGAGPGIGELRPIRAKVRRPGQDR